MSLSGLRSELDQARKEIQKVIIGEEELIQYIFMCFFSVGLNANPHMLIIGKTGTAKTTLAKHLGTVFGLSSKRVDGNGEPMPSDLTGSIDLRTGEFNKGPIFTNFLLLDEINRLSPRTRAVLLAPMAEGIITAIDGGEMILPKPFVVIGTQNPASYGDSAPLRLQENDRFCLSFSTGWPTLENQSRIIDLNITPPSEEPEIQQIFDPKTILAYREQIAKDVFVSEAVNTYATVLTRELLPRESHVARIKEEVQDTSIIRGSRDLVMVARTFAAFCGEGQVYPEHINEVALNVLSHRISHKSILERSSKEIHELIEEVKTSAQERMIR